MTRLNLSHLFTLGTLWVRASAGPGAPALSHSLLARACLGVFTFPVATMNGIVCYFLLGSPSITVRGQKCVLLSFLTVCVSHLQRFLCVRSGRVRTKAAPSLPLQWGCSISFSCLSALARAAKY